MRWLVRAAVRRRRHGRTYPGLEAIRRAQAKSRLSRTQASLIPMFPHMSHRTLPRSTPPDDLYEFDHQQCVGQDERRPKRARDDAAHEENTRTPLCKPQLRARTKAIVAGIMTRQSAQVGDSSDASVYIKCPIRVFGRLSL